MVDMMGCEKQEAAGQRVRCPRHPWPTPQHLLSYTLDTWSTTPSLFHIVTYTLHHRHACKQHHAAPCPQWV